MQSSKVLGEREFITELYWKFPISIKFCDAVRKIEIKKSTLAIYLKLTNEKYQSTKYQHLEKQL